MRKGLSVLNIIFYLAVASILIVSVSPARATERHVYPGGHIQDVISNPDTVDGDVVIVHQGIYYETINFLGKAITVKSSDPNDPNVVAKTILDANQVDSVVIFNNGEGGDSVLSGLTITHGFTDDGGGVFCDAASPTIINCLIKDNQAINCGGGIYCIDANPNITNNKIVDNKAGIDSNPDSGLGGGIYCYDSSPSILNNQIIANRANYAGGGIRSKNNSSPMIEGNTIKENIAGIEGNPDIGWGGGIHSCDNSSPSIVNNQITANRANYAGGGISCKKNSIPTIAGNTIKENFAGIKGNANKGLGGGISCYESSPSIVNNQIIANRANYAGGGIWSYSNSIPTIEGNTIKENFAGIEGNNETGGGGGILCDDSSPSIVNNQIIANRANHAGGGISCTNKSFPEIKGNTIKENFAGIEGNPERGWGGGIYCYDSSPSILNNQIIANRANIGGGGIECTNNSSPTIEGNNIKENFAGIEGNVETGRAGGIYCYVSSPSIVNNQIIANRANLVGGGISCENNSFPTIEGNTIKENFAGIEGNAETGWGGGIYCHDSSPSIVNNQIIANRANLVGGGIESTNNSSPSFVYNLIIKNQARKGGGAIIVNSSPHFINCTFFKNKASGRAFGNGLYCIYGGTTVIKNCILWDGRNEIEKDMNTIIEVSYSDIMDGYSVGFTGSGNKQSDPEFVDPDEGIFHLAAGSPCRDSGDPNILDPDGTRSDMGAYGGTDADWDILVYGPESYQMKIGELFSFHIPASTPDTGVTFSFSEDSPKFNIDSNGYIKYLPEYKDVGTYPIKITVQDNKGRETTMDINIVIYSPQYNPGVAIILCGWYPPFSYLSKLNEEFTFAADFACKTFMNKGFRSIIYLHARPEFISPDIPREFIIHSDPNSDIKDSLVDNINQRLLDPNIIKHDKVQVALFIVGHGETYLYNFNNHEYLSPDDINAILNIDPNSFEEKAKEILTIPILDFCYSGSFLNKISGKDRICITSSNKRSNFLNNSNLSFSNLFFNNIRTGKRIKEAFETVLDYFSESPQDPKLEATGDKYPNYPGDYDNAKIPLGLDIVGGGEWDVIEEYSSSQYIDNPNDLTNDPNDVSLWVKVSEVSNEIDVFALITPLYAPIDPFYYTFENLGNGYYIFKEDDRGIFRFGGKYNIAVYAQYSLDYDQNIPIISKPVEFSVIHTGEDIFEPDNSSSQAKKIYPIDDSKQHHTLHTDSDEDWVIFYGHKDREYSLRAYDIMDTNRSIMLSLCDSNENPIEIGDRTIRWSPDKDGYYYLKIEHGGSFPLNGIVYDLIITWYEHATEIFCVYGRIIDKYGNGINGVQIDLLSNSSSREEVCSTFTASAPYKENSKGWYFLMIAESGEYYLKIKYESFEIPMDSNILIKKGENIKKIKDFVLAQGNGGPSSDPNYLSNFHRVYYYWLDIEDISGTDPNFTNNYASYIEQYRLISLNDPDEDGLMNLDEFLSKTEPKIKNLVCPLYKGLNLFPFHHPHYIDKPYKAYKFFLKYLDNGDSLWIFEEQNQKWDFIRKDLNGEFHYSDPNALLMENGKGYLIYRGSEEPPCKIIYPRETYPVMLLKPGINIRSGYNLLINAQATEGDSSFECLKKLRSQKVKSIIRYDSTQKTHHHLKASYLFFGRPLGEDFPIMKNEAYLIPSCDQKMKKE